MNRNSRLRTRAVRAGREDFHEMGVHAPPIDLSSTYPVHDLERAGRSIQRLNAGQPPLEGEPMAYQTAQFDRMMRGRGIENLLYCGFAADMCILRAPGGLEPMTTYGYRRFMMRDGVVGLEFPDTIDEMLSTRWAVRYFESQRGLTLLSADFIRACKES